MTAAEAKRIIHPDTTLEALAEIESKSVKVAAVDEACLVACVALDKQIPENHFQNECECVVDYGMLYKSIDNKCRSQNCYLHNEYRIVLRNGYPTVCINRQRCYVHILIGELVYGKIRKGYVIHHKDKNKLQLQLYGRNRMQLAEDAAFMAANEVLGLGSGRARAFGEAFVRYSNEIADLVVEDSKADDEIVYAKAVLDRRIREIVGEDNFSPFDERYGRR